MYSRWASDGVDYSLSRDDPTVFDNTPTSELLLVRDDIGLSQHELWRAVRSFSYSVSLLLLFVARSATMIWLYLPSVRGRFLEFAYFPNR